jgi:HEXXH motif-containing protein
MEETVDYRGFSCPQIGIDDEILDLIVVGHAHQLLETLMERHGVHLDHHAPGISHLVTKWLSRSDDEKFDTVWNPAFGDIHALLLSQSAADLVRCAAAVALRINECGHACDWKADLPVPARFRFDRWLLPMATAIDVSPTPSGLVVRTKAAGSWHSTTFMHCAEHGWNLANPENVDTLPVCRRTCFQFTFSSAEALSRSGAERLLQADAYHFDCAEVSIREEWRSTCEDALTLIAETSTLYAKWVGRVLNHLLPLRARPSTFNSGSERFSPGVICVSDQPLQWPLAEMLVHEATHQYLHIINRLGPLDDGTDDRLYYSPFRNKNRPIFFIVVAYHAFANVLLFYRTARQRGIVPGIGAVPTAFVDREETLQKQLQAIEGPLKNTKSLTLLGRALWEPLYDVLHA